MTSVRSRREDLDAAVAETGRTNVSQASRFPTWAGPGAVGVGLGMATLYTALVNPNTSGAFPQCITKKFTGLDCPMCGGLRSVHALTQGDLVGALDHNAVAVILVPLLGLLWAAMMLRSLGHEPPKVRVPSWAPWVGIVALLAFSVVRNTALPGMAWLDSQA